MFKPYMIIKFISCLNEIKEERNSYDNYDLYKCFKWLFCEIVIQLKENKNRKLLDYLESQINILLANISNNDNSIYNKNVKSLFLEEKNI